MAQQASAVVHALVAAKMSQLVSVALQVYGASLKDPENACLVMELVKGGNLHQRIYDRSSPRLTHLEILQVSVPHDSAHLAVEGGIQQKRQGVQACSP